jgi:ribose transport system substrate-binding protein
MIATGYIPSVVASKSLRTLGDKRIKFIGIDDDPIVLEAIKDGFVAGTMAQNPYGQGYIAAYVMDIMASGGAHGEGRRAVGQGTPQTKVHRLGDLVISQANLETYKDDLKKITTDIQGKFKDTYLNCQ